MDRQRITELAKRHGAALVLYARQWCRDPDDAFQEALMDMMQLRRPPNDPAGWLFTTVKRKAMNHARSEARRQKYTDAFASEQDAWFVTQPNSSLEVEQVVMQLQELEAMEREIVVAKIWGDLNFEQIADLVGSSRSSVHRCYRSALEKLAKGCRADKASASRDPTNKQTEPKYERRAAGKAFDSIEAKVE